MAEAERTSPFQGLIPFSEKDVDYFFGREAEGDRIIANLYSASLTLLYGGSGVGKSSVLRAGVCTELRKRPEDVIFFYINEWQDDPLPALRLQIQKAMETQTGLRSDLSGLSLAQCIDKCAEELKRRIMVIFDQFEEFFTYHTPDAEFALQLPNAVARRRLPIGFLIALREDGLAKLDVFKGQIPHLFDNYLRMSPLPARFARDAIVKPLDLFNHRFPGESRVLEPSLVPELLKEVRADEVSKGKGTDKPFTEDTPIDLPYLQLVLARLWKPDDGTGRKDLSTERLRLLGGAQEIVSNHLRRVLGSEKLSEPQRAVLARIFDELVMPSGSKIAASLSDLTKRAKSDVGTVKPILELLAKGEDRILREVPPNVSTPDDPRYEIYHDRLAEPILAWVTERQAKEAADIAAARAERAEREKLQKRRTVLVSVGAVLVAVLAVLAVYLWLVARHQEKTAEEDYRKFRQSIARHVANSLAGAAQKARTARAQDSLTPVLLAWQAYTALPNDETRTAVSTSLRRPLKVIDSAGIELIQFPDDDHVVVITKSGQLKWWDLREGDSSSPVLKELGTDILYSDFSADVSKVLVIDRNGTLTIRSPGEPQNNMQLPFKIGVADGLASRVFAFAPSGNRVAYVEGELKVWDRAQPAANPATINRPDKSKPIQTVIFAPNNQRLAIVFRDGSVAVANAEKPRDGMTLVVSTLSYRADSSFEPEIDEMPQVNDICFSADSERMGIAFSDGTIGIYAVKDGKRLRGLSPKTRQFEWLRIAFSATTSGFAACDQRGAIRIWPDVEQDSFESLSLASVSWGYLGFSPKLTRVTVAHDEKRIQVYSLLPIPEPIAEARKLVGDKTPTVDDYIDALGDLASDLTTGREYAEKGEEENALASLNEALKLPGVKFNAKKEYDRISARHLIAQARDLAATDHLEDATKLLKEAVANDPSLKIDPEADAKRFAAPSHYRKARVALDARHISEAFNEFRLLTELDPSFPVPADDWNDLGWNAALEDHLQEASFASNAAVKSDPGNGSYRDTRGVVLALLGDRPGAIKEFEFAIQSKALTAEEKKVRKQWLDDLKRGKNPLTPKVLDVLRKQ
jgi:tetratricopeptide (TPR) repeat protein